MTMKLSLILFALVALLSVWQSVGAKIGKRSEDCVPGANWFDGCNNCFCSSTGLVVCTLKQCITLPADSLTKIERAKMNEQECEPGTTFERECNTCVCTKSGIAACTLMACISSIESTEADRK
ncbi:Serine protease inhibitor I/II [Pseudolycoriella hygida]|uniref:Protease inhibitor n=1 Tax=Pseudolycoriella hygida TaxID=35572 RepID=A0A9Q0MZZ8_9DIPT|nr:Serine protease inhibitor I/II [Pseudolycoriella hygida]